MREKVSTVADLVYSITQQVFLCMPNSLKRGSGSMQSIKSHTFH